ncbi:hypothetical protein NPS01_41860 [Nocardioides psychrotolerans]|uniref:phosphotransferase n=1 Tax=Nocardioides psychrotolerans TaxID=1005945 RepID=UPI001190CEBA|nr:phosphotransferase [Nocardioides psychrotolerans]GEP40523.1 hypothetical protein NPS01_41860 [Nocardioides psychrotolerans]
MALLSADVRAWVESVLGPVSAVRELTGGWTSTMLALTRERDVQRLLVTTPVPAPVSLALDAAGEHCGVAAHLMTLVPLPVVGVGGEVRRSALASDAGLWEEAFAVLRTDPPAYECCLIHRDFHHRNVLWVGEEVGGVVDWVETSTGRPGSTSPTVAPTSRSATARTRHSPSPTPTPTSCARGVSRSRSSR